ncbi:mitochondrial fission process protein 1 [Willisornis vidua]|uniref:Mitochondrial fission process protein 1 n=1 Tax=Willisornis vidua TaxID=1566151 RepID=A0ABQ9DLP5_9PASS|nr:mitochondrial fission process protein 1 [Willisornis vidua]
MASLETQTKSLCADKWGMGTKQEEMEICAHLRDCDLIGTTETWCDGSCDWSVGVEGNKFFRKDKKGKQAWAVSLYAKDQLECVELHLGMDGELAESLWVRNTGRERTGGIRAGICYRLSR